MTLAWFPHIIILPESFAQYVSRVLLVLWADICFNLLLCTSDQFGGVLGGGILLYLRRLSLSG